MRRYDLPAADRALARADALYLVEGRSPAGGRSYVETAHLLARALLALYEDRRLERGARRREEAHRTALELDWARRHRA